MTTYIGLTGYPGSGKDTAADLMTERLERAGYTVYRTAFARAMKDMLIAIDPVYSDTVGGIYTTALDVLEAWKRRTAEHSNQFYEFLSLNATREKLQNLGEVMRGIDPDFWVKRTMKEIEEAGSFDVVIITDVRYPNEEDIIRKRFGCIWAIKRPGCEAVNSHESERMTARIIMDADYTYHNQGSVGDLASDLSFGLDDRFGNILEAL